MLHRLSRLHQVFRPLTLSGERAKQLDKTSPGIKPTFDITVIKLQIRAYTVAKALQSNHILKGSLPVSYQESIKLTSQKHPLRILIVGVGKRGKYAFQEISKLGNLFTIVALCDKDKATLLSVAKTSVRCFADVKELLQSHARIDQLRIDCAYVALPHRECSTAILQLLKAGIHVLKEKPAAMEPKDLAVLQDTARQNRVILLTASQARYGERYELIKKWMPLLGRIQFVEGHRKIWVDDLGIGVSHFALILFADGTLGSKFLRTDPILQH